MATAESKKIENLKESCTEAVGGTCISCVLESRGIKRNRNRSYYNVTASSELKQSGEYTHAFGCYPVYSICINKQARR